MVPTHGRYFSTKSTKYSREPLDNPAWRITTIANTQVFFFFSFFLFPLSLFPLCVLLTNYWSSSNPQTNGTNQLSFIESSKHNFGISLHLCCIVHGKQARTIYIGRLLHLPANCSQVLPKSEHASAKKLSTELKVVSTVGLIPCPCLPPLPDLPVGVTAGQGCPRPRHKIHSDPVYNTFDLSGAFDKNVTNLRHPRITVLYEQSESLDPT